MFPRCPLAVAWRGLGGGEYRVGAQPGDRQGGWGAWGKKEKRSGNNMKVRPVKLADLGDVRKLEASALTPSYSVA